MLKGQNFQMILRYPEPKPYIILNVCKYKEKLAAEGDQKNGIKNHFKLRSIFSVKTISLLNSYLYGRFTYLLSCLVLTCKFRKHEV